MTEEQPIPSLPVYPNPTGIRIASKEEQKPLLKLMGRMMSQRLKLKAGKVVSQSVKIKHGKEKKKAYYW